jgi:hypothetical protein
MHSLQIIIANVDNYEISCVYRIEAYLYSVPMYIGHVGTHIVFPVNRDRRRGKVSGSQFCVRALSKITFVIWRIYGAQKICRVFIFKCKNDNLYSLVSIKTNEKLQLYAIGNPCRVLVVQRGHKGNQGSVTHVEISHF